MLCQLSYIHHQPVPGLRGANLARLEGIEPPTVGLEIRCSIQLSYRRVSGTIPLTYRPSGAIRWAPS
jgi:hypothetical protein